MLLMLRFWQMSLVKRSSCWKYRDLPFSHGEGITEPQNAITKQNFTSVKQDDSMTCTYCLEKGHWKNQCRVAATSNQGSRSVKPIAPAGFSVP